MTIFSLARYEYKSTETLTKFNVLAREKYLMEQVQAYFDEHGFRGQICLGFERDECECLMRDGLLLAYFFSERGGRNLIAFFESIYDAFDYLACRHLGIPKLPFDWPELNRQFDDEQAG